MSVLAPTALADIGPGFRDATHGPQRVFRCLLDAFAHPGRVLTLPAVALDGMQAPAGLGQGAAASLLALLDAETDVHLAGSAAPASAWLRFHTGVGTAPISQAGFVAVRAAECTEALWNELALGSDEVPQDGATLLIEVDRFHRGQALTLRGPGIASTQALHVAGLPEAFWHWRLDLEAQRPRGVDLLLVQGTQLAAIPRSTRLSLEG
jgi:alpha-D-ribose 1-methylphosphonate 5-triphosphate synthase subunit PhnH